MELEDVSGRTFYWLRRQERPLECILYEGSAQVGSVQERLLIHQMHADFAGILWEIDFPRTGPRIGFAQGKIVLARGSGPNFGFRLAIDTGEIYRLTSPRYDHAEWYFHEKSVASIRRTGGVAGEIEISPDASPLHAPLLVILTALQAVRGRIYWGVDPSSTG